MEKEIKEIGGHERMGMFLGMDGFVIALEKALGGRYDVRNQAPKANRKNHWIRCPPNTPREGPGEEAAQDCRGLSGLRTCGTRSGHPEPDPAGHADEGQPEYPSGSAALPHSKTLPLLPGKDGQSSPPNESLNVPG